MVFGVPSDSSSADTFWKGVLGEVSIMFNSNICANKSMEGEERGISSGEDALHRPMQELQITEGYFPVSHTLLIRELQAEE